MKAQVWVYRKNINFRYFELSHAKHTKSIYSYKLIPFYTLLIHEITCSGLINYIIKKTAFTYF